MSTSPIRMSSPHPSTSAHHAKVDEQESSLHNLTPPDSESSEVDSTDLTTTTIKNIVERPSLHSYTSFEVAFDLHPPPSPPPSPKIVLSQEGGKGWWRV